MDMKHKGRQIWLFIGTMWFINFGFALIENQSIVCQLIYRKCEMNDVAWKAFEMA